MRTECGSDRAGGRVPGLARGLRDHIHPTIRSRSSAARPSRREAADGDVTGSVARPPKAAGGAPPLTPELLGTDPNDDLSIGKKYFRQGSYGLAERHFRKAVELHPRDAEVLARPCRVLRPAQALRSCRPRLRAGDQASIGATPEIMNNQGFSYMLRGDYRRARATLLAAQAQGPEKPLHRATISALLDESARKAKAHQLASRPPLSACNAAWLRHLRGRASITRLEAEGMAILEAILVRRHQEFRRRSGAAATSSPADSTTSDYRVAHGGAAGPRRERSTATCPTSSATSCNACCKQRFELDDAAADELIEQAAAADEKAVDLYHFTRLLNGSLDEDERLRMIEMMWADRLCRRHGLRVRGQPDLARRRSARRVVDRAHRAAPSRRRRARPDRHDAGHAHHRRLGRASAPSWRACLPGMATIWCWWRGASSGLNALAAEIAAARPAAAAGAGARSGAAGRRRADRRGAGGRAGSSRDIVVNNAGFGLVGRAAELARAEQLGMIDLNVRALDRPVAGVRRQPGAASRRHAQRRLGRGLPAGAGLGGLLRQQGLRAVVQRGAARELAPRGIRVTCLCPGPVATEFQARAGIAEARAAVAAGGHRPSGWREAGYRGLMRGQRVVVPGLANRLLATLAPRFVPRGVLLAQLDARQLNARKPSPEAAA